MGLYSKNLSDRARRLCAVGATSMLISSLLRLFFQPAPGSARNWLHAVIGALLGFSLVIYLAAFRDWKASKNDRA
jgi:phosphate/sulfate permease